MKVLTALAYVCATLFAASFARTTRAAYVTDFEAPMFTSGPISGQDGWNTPAAVANTARVLTATELETELYNAGINPGQTVGGGSQALLVSGAGNSSATIRQVPGLESTNPVVLDFMARPLRGTTGAPIGNIFLTMEDAAGTRAAAIRFGPQTIDYGTTVTGIWQSAGMPWDEETWYRFTINADYETKTYDLSIDGTQLNTEPIPFYNAGSQNLSQIRIFRGANQAGMIVDDLSVAPVPEPASAATALVATTMLLLRRRRLAV